ncbi:hypothetical protein TNCV_3372161 [Trichonephila clavipes]|nr:hypothetical protein TNCV_3372161 [Trichonephila clavipes]
MNDSSCYRMITSSLQHQEYDYYQTRASATFSSTSRTDFTVRRRTAPCRPLSTDEAHNQSSVTGKIQQDTSKRRLSHQISSFLQIMD